MSIKNELISPKLDIVFKMIFGEEGCEKITKDLIQCVLGEKIDSVNLSQTPKLTGDYTDDKYSEVDVIAVVNGNTKIDIEMQMNNKSYIIKRLLSYWAKLYNKQLKIGDDYSELTRSICIMFVNENIEMLKDLKAFTSWKIIEEKERTTVLTNDFQLCIIELSKAKKYGTNKELAKWIEFLDNPNGENIRNMKNKDDAIDKAVKRLEEITANEELMAKIEARKKYYLDMNTAKVVAKKEGYNEGLSKGRTEGRDEEKAEIAKEMLKSNIDIDTISKITKLSKQEIEKLK